MARVRKSKKTAAICVLASILLIAASLLLSTTQAAAQPRRGPVMEMERIFSRTVTALIQTDDTRWEDIPIDYVEGALLRIGLHFQEGTASFQDGRTATYSSWGQFITMEGSRGFIKNEFTNGSTWATYEATATLHPDGHYTLEGTFTYIGGTDRFEGIHGTGVFEGTYYPPTIGQGGHSIGHSTAVYTLPWMLRRLREPERILPE